MSAYKCDHPCGRSPYWFRGNQCEWERWCSARLCRDCDRTAQSVSDAAGNRILGLPPLTGSEKQIAWAESIRSAAMKSPLNNPILAPLTADVVRKIKSAYPTITLDRIEEGRGVIEQAMADARNHLETETSARWWIDNRDSAERFVLEAENKAGHMFFAAEELARIETQELAEAERKAAEAARIAAWNQECAQNLASAESETQTAISFLVGASLESCKSDNHGNLTLLLTNGVECRATISKYDDPLLYEVAGYHLSGHHEPDPSDTVYSERKRIEDQIEQWARQVGWGDRKVAAR